MEQLIATLLARILIAINVVFKELKEEEEICTRMVPKIGEAMAAAPFVKDLNEVEEALEACEKRGIAIDMLEQQIKAIQRMISGLVNLSTLPTSEAAQVLGSARERLKTRVSRSVLDEAFVRESAAWDVEHKRLELFRKCEKFMRENAELELVPPSEYATANVMTEWLKDAKRARRLLHISLLRPLFEAKKALLPLAKRLEMKRLPVRLTVARCVSLSTEWETECERRESARRKAEAVECAKLDAVRKEREEAARMDAADAEKRRDEYVAKLLKFGWPIPKNEAKVMTGVQIRSRYEVAAREWSLLWDEAHRLLPDYDWEESVRVPIRDGKKTSWIERPKQFTIQVLHQMVQRGHAAKLATERAAAVGKKHETSPARQHQGRSLSALRAEICQLASRMPRGMRRVEVDGKVKRLPNRFVDVNNMGEEELLSEHERLTKALANKEAASSKPAKQTEGTKREIFLEICKAAFALAGEPNEHLERMKRGQLNMTLTTILDKLADVKGALNRLEEKIASAGPKYREILEPRVARILEARKTSGERPAN